MKDIRAEIVPLIKRVLTYMDAYSEPALQLMLGTAAAESSLMYRRQLGSGPARGIWQMEPATAMDMVRYLRTRRPSLYRKILGFWNPTPEQLREALEYNDELACALARVKYLTDPLPIPNTLKGQAETWKRWYNTYLGAQDVNYYLHRWKACGCEELLSTEIS